MVTPESEVEFSKVFESMAKHLLLNIVTVCLAITICTAETSSKAFVNDAGCQHRSTSGRDYRGIEEESRLVGGGLGLDC